MIVLLSLRGSFAYQELWRLLTVDSKLSGEAAAHAAIERELLRDAIALAGCRAVAPLTA